MHFIYKSKSQSQEKDWRGCLGSSLNRWWFVEPCPLWLLPTSLCWQASMRCCSIFKEGFPPTMPKSTKTCFNDHGIIVLDWQTISPDLNLTGNPNWPFSRRWWETPKLTMQMSCRLVLKQFEVHHHHDRVKGYSPQFHISLMLEEPRKSIECVYCIVKSHFSLISNLLNSNLFLVSLLHVVAQKSLNSYEFLVWSHKVYACSMFYTHKFSATTYNWPHINTHTSHFLNLVPVGC